MMMQLKRRILNLGGVDSTVPAHPQLEALRRLWMEKRGDRPAPGRADFTIEDLRPWFGHLMILDCLPGGDFRYRLYGSDLAMQFGFDLTGRDVSEASRMIGEKPLEEYREVLFSGKPLYVSRSSPSSHKHLCVDKLALPLADGSAITKILGAIYLSEQI
ncbi:MAG TPA: PAS domain-containing protein [Ferrovibrio sp.]|jgi:hypothetical protein|uniref:PAS domain-containing protein n=1 Tax=Ferrovibrio sp. TaxID=1917215 RepID=UPI002ED35904